MGQAIKVPDEVFQIRGSWSNPTAAFIDDNNHVRLDYSKNTLYQIKYAGFHLDQAIPSDVAHGDVTIHLSGYQTAADAVVAFGIYDTDTPLFEIADLGMGPGESDYTATALNLSSTYFYNDRLTMYISVTSGSLPGTIYLRFVWVDVVYTSGYTSAPATTRTAVASTSDRLVTSPLEIRRAVK